MTAIGDRRGRGKDALLSLMLAGRHCLRRAAATPRTRAGFYLEPPAATQSLPHVVLPPHIVPPHIELPPECGPHQFLVSITIAIMLPHNLDHKMLQNSCFFKCYCNQHPWGYHLTHTLFIHIYFPDSTTAFSNDITVGTRPQNKGGYHTHVSRVLPHVCTLFVYCPLDHKSRYWLAILFTTNYTQLTIWSSCVV